VSRRRLIDLKIDTEGQRLLVEQKLPPVKLAKLIGVSAQRLDEWRTGTTRPSGANARKIFVAVGIPVDSWARLPGTTTPEPEATTEKRALTSLAEIDEMLAALRGGGALVEKERAKRSAERIALLRLKASIEYRDALAEDAIVRGHPHWRRIREAIRTALAKYPEALASLAAELGALGEWEAATAELTADEDE